MIYDQLLMLANKKFNDHLIFDWITVTLPARYSSDCPAKKEEPDTMCLFKSVWMSTTFPNLPFRPAVGEPFHWTTTVSALYHLVCQARLAQSDRASDSYDLLKRVNLKAASSTLAVG